MYYQTHYSSPLGELTLACEGINHQLVGLWIEKQKYFADTLPSFLPQKNDLAIFDRTKRWLDGYFAGQKPELNELPLAPQGGAFRQAVWAVLCQIPYGSVTTYGAIAKVIAVQQGRCHMSAQAIGGAVGRNPISIIIPCHRIIGSNGNLTGYAGGLDIKRWLLNFEQANLSNFFTPSAT